MSNDRGRTILPFAVNQPGLLSVMGHERQAGKHARYHETITQFRSTALSEAFRMEEGMATLWVLATFRGRQSIVFEAGPRFGVSTLEVPGRSLR